MIRSIKTAVIYCHIDTYWDQLTNDTVFTNDIRSQVKVFSCFDFRPFSEISVSKKQGA